MATPTAPDEMIGLVEDMVVMDIKLLTPRQLHDLTRMARHIAHVAEEESRRRNRPEDYKNRQDEGRDQ